MTTPFTSILSTITVKDSLGSLVTSVSSGSLTITFPDLTTQSLSLNAGITNMGGGQYQAPYNTKGPGSIRELWSMVISGGDIAQFQFIVEVGY